MSSRGRRTGLGSLLRCRNLLRLQFKEQPLDKLLAQSFSLQLRHPQRKIMPTCGLKDRSYRQVDTKGLAHQHNQLHRQQRMSPEGEEVVVAADALDAQRLRPDRRQHLLGRGAGRRVGAAGVGPPGAPGAGSARRSSLPLGVSGSASSASNADGTMYSGNRARRNARSSAAPGAPPAAAGTT